MKLILVAILVLLKANFAAAQSASIDWLKHELSIVENDTTKVRLLLELSYRYNWSYADTSVMYAGEAMELAKKINVDTLINFAQNQMSSALITVGNYPLALDYAFQALPWVEKYGAARDKCFANIGIAMIYREQGYYNSSLIYCRKALAISDTIRSPGFDHASIWGIVGSVYEKNNQPDSAILFAKRAYEVNSDWSGVLYVLGNAYLKKNNYDSAMIYYRAGLPIAVKNHTEIDLIDIYIGISNIKRAQGNLDSAAWYAKKALAEKVGKTYPLGLLRSADLLVDIYQSQNNVDSTLTYLKVSLGLKDSLFNREKTIAIQNLAFKEEQKQEEVTASKLEYQNRLKMYSLLGVLTSVMIIAFILFRNNRRRQKAFALLQKQKQETDIQKAKAEKTLDELKAAQAQLIQSEKMASLGELTAGIAHEIENPLNFVNNFSDVNRELLQEASEEMKHGNIDDARLILNDIKENEEKINHHGKRADTIIKAMLQHSRSGNGTIEPTDINALAEEYLKLAYHGMRGKDKSINISLKTDFDPAIKKIGVIPQDIGRVLLNLYNNAFYAVSARSGRDALYGVSTNENYQPQVTVTTKKKGNQVEIMIKDNGNGIPKNIVDKIFQPFFTTKPTGQGTGLGLSLAYDIIKAHSGEIKVISSEGEGTEFIIILNTNV